MQEDKTHEAAGSWNRQTLVFRLAVLALCFGLAGLICLMVLSNCLELWIDTRPYAPDPAHGYIFLVESHGALIYVTSFEHRLYSILNYGSFVCMFATTAIGLLGVYLERRTDKVN